MLNDNRSFNDVFTDTDIAMPDVGANIASTSIAIVIFDILPSLNGVFGFVILTVGNLSTSPL